MQKGADMKDELYQAITLEMNHLAKMIVNKHYEIHPEFKAYGVNGYTKSVQDAQYNLQFLLTAYQYNNEDLFCHYLEWTDSLFNNIKLPKNTLLQHLELLKATLFDYLGTQTIDIALKNQLLLLLTESMEWLNSNSKVVDTNIGETILRDPYYQRYEAAIFKGDREALNILFSDMKIAQLSMEFIYGEILETFQRNVGKLWHEQQISVAKEHYSTAMSQYAMTLLYDQIFTTQRIGKKMFAACVSGELHEFGIRLIADYFEYKGWDSAYYGANNSEMALVQAIKEQKPDIIFLSCTMTYHLDHLERLIQEIKRSNIKVPICVGGYLFGISPILSEQIGADFYTSGFREAFQLAESIVL